MKVDVLSGVSRNEGGLFYSVRWLSKSLINAGVDARLVSHMDEHTEEDLPLWSPMPVELYSAKGPILSSSKLRKILAASDAELLHVHGIWRDNQWAALGSQKKTGRPVVISPRGMLDPWALANSAWKKKLIGALFADESLCRASCIHALCESEARSIRAYGLKTPVAVIPNGVELPEPGRLEREDERKQLLFLGRVHPKKGLKELLAGWARAKPAGWKLLIAGWDDGGHEAGLKKLAEDLDIAGDISFLGPIFGDEKDRLLRSVDAFVLPSFSEGLPMSVLEAWSYTLPVVMTDFCNIPSGFEAEAALRVEPNEAAIAAGLNTLSSMADRDLAAMGAKGRALVEERFTWDRIATDTRDVYRWCLGGDKPACIREA